MRILPPERPGQGSEQGRTMIIATCTCFTNPPERCGRTDECTTVRVVHLDGRVTQEHQVCAGCRERLKLPEHDADLTVFDMIAASTAG